MKSHPNWAFVHKQSSLLSLLCLVVLLPYLLLPAIYYGHLTEQFLSASHEDPRAGPLAIGSYPEKLSEPCHDSNSCPICQAASSFQDYGFFSLPQVPASATQVRIAAFISPTFIIANYDFLVSGPRAPPISL